MILSNILSLADFLPIIAIALAGLVLLWIPWYASK